ncbi:MAG: serine--tRNA ligase [Planctomycetota bacterium]
MIDIKLIRDNPDAVKRAAADKNMTVDIDRILAVDARRRELETEFNELRRGQKDAGETIPVVQRVQGESAKHILETAKRLQQQFEASPSLRHLLRQQNEQISAAMKPVIEKFRQMQEATEPISRLYQQMMQDSAPMRKAFAEQYQRIQESLARVTKSIIQATEPLKNRLKEIDTERESIDAELHELMLLVPQIPHPDAPVGPTEESNVEVRRVGQPRPANEFGFELKDHLDLGNALGLMDIERGVKLAGSRNYVLTGRGAQLHEAVLRLAWDIMLQRRFGKPGDPSTKLSFQPLTVPPLVNDKLMYGTGFFPLHRDEVYLCERDGQSLVGTAEVPVTGLHGDEILEADEMPKLYFARSTCFRREAGAGGQDTRGLYRIHYFDKIEQVVVCQANAEESAYWHEVIISNSEAVLQALGLPYRLVEVCTGEMGQGKHRMFDLETWMPSRQAYSETHSASSFHDFQARRLNLRYRNAETGKPEFCHTLNNTVVASPRILIPLLELNQNADGTVTIPPALRPYMNGQELLKP